MKHDFVTELPEGKLKISRLGRPLGQPSDEPEMLSCFVTFIDPEEDSLIRQTYGVAGLRRHKLLRITGEAYEQSVELSQEVISFDILGCGLRTLQRDVALFSSYGVHVPFQRSPNPARYKRFTYRVASAKKYLEGNTREEIASYLCHDVHSIGRFIDDFARFVRLAGSGISLAHISTVVDCPDNLLQEFLILFRDYNTPQLFKRLDLFAQSAS